MEYFSILYLIFLLININIIYTKEISIQNIIDISINNLPLYTDKILAIKGKTNKTKCIAKEDIKINDTLFQFQKKDLITNEKCPFPDREKITKKINKLTNNTIIKNKLILSFCLLHLYQNKNSSEIHEKAKNYILNIPLNNLNFTEKFYSFDDLNEYLKTGRYYSNEADLIDRVFSNILNTNIKNELAKLFSKIYYYISYN